VKNILIKKSEEIDMCDDIIIPGGVSNAMSII
jgi:glutamine amidotransferase PdxT